MLARIETKFDVGDICYYHHHGSFDSNPYERIKVKITEVNWMISPGEVTVWYDCKSVDSKHPYFSVINHMCMSYEKYFFEDEENKPHPIDFEHDFKYNFNDEVLVIHNNSIYGRFPPEPVHITKFCYTKSEKYLNGNVNGYSDKYSFRGYEPTSDKQWWNLQESWERGFDCVIDKLPDDYLEKCWKNLCYSDVFRFEKYGYKTDHEKLFEYLGITDKAKQAYEDYKAGKFRKKTTPKKKVSGKNSKVDSLLNGLTEEEKKELLKKLMSQLPLS